MIIFQKNKCVFFHNPRTGGYAFSNDLGIVPETNPCQHWSTERAIKWIFQETWDDYWSFAFVRNPWDRYVSLYEHLYNSPIAPYPKSNSYNGEAKLYSFDEWMYLSKSKFIRSAVFGLPQSNWTNGVNKVFRFEERDDSLPEISERIGIPLANIKSNVSVKKLGTYTNYFKKKDTIRMVNDIDKEVIERFGYKFGE